MRGGCILYFVVVCCCLWFYGPSGIPLACFSALRSCCFGGILWRRERSRRQKRWDRSLLLSQTGHVRSQSTFRCVIAPLQSDSTRKCQSRVFHVNRKDPFCPDGPPHLLGLASAPKTIAGQRELLGRLRLRLLPPAVISYDPGNCCVRQCKPNPGGAQSVLVKKYLYWKE